MKVLMINSVCGIRSTGRICTDLADTLTSEGHEVKIAYGRETVPEQYQHYAVRIGNTIDLQSHALKTRLWDNHGFASKKATLDFLEWADTYDPDLLWLHNLHGYYLNVEILFNWIKQRPQMQVKWTLHDCWAFTGHCTYFTMVHCDRWKEHCRTCPQKKDYPSSYGKDNSYLNFERKRSAFTGVKQMTLITPSQWLADLVKQSFLGEYPVEVRYNTVNTDIFKPTYGDFKEQYGLQNKRMILGVASVWSARKGLQDFIKLAEMLDERYAIVLVGLDEKQKAHIPANILAVPNVTRVEELAEIYTAADVLFNPTYEDNYPTVNLEAEACGTPVITYRTGGAPETIHRKDSTVIDVGHYEQVLQTDFFRN